MLAPRLWSAPRPVAPGGARRQACAMTAPIRRPPVIASGLAAWGLVWAGGRALADDDGLTRVRLKTGKGDVVLALETTKAPITAGNFLHYVDARRFDHASFYRV